MHTQNIEDLIEVLHLGTAFHEVADRLVGPFDGSRDLIHILRLDNSLEVILQNLGEVV
jgi:hypothetical protein